MIFGLISLDQKICSSQFTNYGLKLLPLNSQTLLEFLLEVMFDYHFLLQLMLFGLQIPSYAFICFNR